MIKNILAIIGGLLGGSVVNMGLVQIGHQLLPIQGIDPSDIEALAKIISTLDFKYFIFPFLAHALGTLAGAIIASAIAKKHKMKFALAIGLFFLLGGIAVNTMIPGPLWFTITDLTLAYLPMAWLGGIIVTKKS